MMALGHQLGADDDVELARGDVVEFLAQPLHRIDQIARQHQNALVGKQRGRFLFEPFDAGTDGCETFGGVTVRTGFRLRGVVAAVMADQPLLEAVIDQPGVAIRTLQTKAASAA